MLVSYIFEQQLDINPIALHSILNAKMETHDSVVLGRCGSSKNKENSSPHAPVKPSCKTPRVMESTFLVNLSVTII